MLSKQRLVAIVGPTASGKSELAVSIARRYKGEIISADSVQVYKGLNIGSAKVNGEWQVTNPNNKKFIYKNIPHYCIDFVNPKKRFTVAEYKTCADSAIVHITKRKKLPILVGGTGFYIQAVVDGIILPEVLPNKNLRKELAKKSLDELSADLGRLDPVRAKMIDVKNSRRLIRAIEIVTATKKSITPLKRKSRYNTLLIGIRPSDDVLRKNIERRARVQIATGLLREVRELRSQKIPRKRIQELGFEYRLALQCVEGIISDEKLTELLITANWQYAKRQMTWFKRDRRIHWVRSAEEAFVWMDNFLA